MFPPDLLSNPYTPTSPVESEVGEGGDEVVPQVNEEEREKEAYEIPVPDDGDELLFGDDIDVGVGDDGYWEIGFGNGPVVGIGEGCTDEWNENPELGEWLFKSTAHSKQKVEIQWNTLAESERVKFQAAKQKEIKAWVDRGTVCRLAKGTLRDDQIMRCRWILIWKPPAPGTTEERAKAALSSVGSKTLSFPPSQPMLQP